MATSIVDIGTEIKTRLLTIKSLKKVWGLTELPSTVNEFPSALIVLGSTKYHKDFESSMDNTFRVIVLLTNQDLPSAFTKLIPYIATDGDDSVTAAIEASTANLLKVTENNGAGALPWGGGVYLSSEWTVICQD